MNTISEFIKRNERNNFPFVPNAALYAATNIGRKRFGKILRNETSPTIDEVAAIARYFNVSIGELINQED